jgi:hypothetical protein
VTVERSFDLVKANEEESTGPDASKKKLDCALAIEEEAQMAQDRFRNKWR